MIDFLIPIPFAIGFLLVPLLGLILIKLTKFRRVGIALLIIFFGFLLYVVLGFLLSLLSAKVFDAHPG
jgi:hypothetical protein